METNYNYNPQPGYTPAKPDSYMLWAILSTICCCVPFGIVSIIYAAKVNGLYQTQQYEAAEKASADAKKWAIISAAVGAAVNILYMIYYAVVGFGTLMGN